MNNVHTWQTHALAQLSLSFAADPAAKAVDDTPRWPLLSPAIARTKSAWRRLQKSHEALT